MSQGLSKIQKNIHRGVLMFGLLAVGWLGVSGSVWAAKQPSESCSPANENAKIQTVEKKSTRGTSTRVFTLWQCGRNFRYVYEWKELESRENTPFPGIDCATGYDCSPSNPGGGIKEADCGKLTPPGVCAKLPGPTGSENKGPCSDKSPMFCFQPPSGGECSSKGGTCGSDKTCTGTQLNTADCIGPPVGGGNMVCCVPKPGGDGPSGSTETISFPNPLKFDTFQDLVMGVLAYLQGIIVLLAVVFIVFGGVLYLISGGNEGWIKTAKSAITAAMIGLAIGIGAPTFLREIVTILCTTGGSGAIICPIDQAPIAGAISLWQILINTLNFLLGITGILAVIMLVIGGGMYLTSAGVDKRIDTGKDIIKYAVLGIIVVLAALVIVRQIASLFI